MNLSEQTIKKMERRAKNGAALFEQIKSLSVDFLKKAGILDESKLRILLEYAKNKGYNSAESADKILLSTDNNTELSPTQLAIELGKEAGKISVSLVAFNAINKLFEDTIYSLQENTDLDLVEACKDRDTFATYFEESTIKFLSKDKERNDELEIFIQDFIAEMRRRVQLFLTVPQEYLNAEQLKMFTDPDTDGIRKWKIIYNQVLASIFEEMYVVYVKQEVGL